MMKGDGGLNHPLQEFLLGSRGGPPHVFQHLVGFEEPGLVKQSNPAGILIKMHGSLCHNLSATKQNLAPGGARFLKCG